MSRIGKMPIVIPDKVKVSVDEKNVVKVEGPLGTLTQKVDSAIAVEIEDKEILVKRASDLKNHRAMHGLYRSLIFNMVEGVSNGYSIELQLNGVGYRVSVNGQIVELGLGYSHDILFQLPEEIKVEAETKKGEAPKLILKSYDKQLVGMVAAKIRSYRKPEPYKGKGILYKGEVVRRKAGKTASA